MSGTVLVVIVLVVVLVVVAFAGRKVTVERQRHSRHLGSLEGDRSGGSELRAALDQAIAGSSGVGQPAGSPSTTADSGLRNVLDAAGRVSAEPEVVSSPEVERSRELLGLGGGLRESLGRFLESGSGPDADDGGPADDSAVGDEEPGDGRDAGTPVEAGRSGLTVEAADEAGSPGIDDDVIVSSRRILDAGSGSVPVLRVDDGPADVGLDDVGLDDVGLDDVGSDVGLAGSVQSDVGLDDVGSVGVPVLRVDDGPADVGLDGVGLADVGLDDGGLPGSEQPDVGVPVLPGGGVGDVPVLAPTVPPSGGAAVPADIASDEPATLLDPGLDPGLDPVVDGAVDPGLGAAAIAGPTLPDVPNRMPTVADRWRDRAIDRLDGEPIEQIRRPLPGTSLLRQALQWVLIVGFLASFAGATVLLLVWQQARSAGLLSDQLESARDAFDLIRQVERWSAYLALVIGSGWMASATYNVRRVTGARRNPLGSAMSLWLTVVGVWLVGDEVIASATDDTVRYAGFLLRVVFVVLPWLVLERIAVVAYARRSALRLAFAAAVGYLAVLDFATVVSTVEFPAEVSGPATGPGWGTLAIHVTLGAVMKLIGVLAVVESTRSIERATARRAAALEEAERSGELI